MALLKRRDLQPYQPRPYPCYLRAANLLAGLGRHQQHAVLFATTAQFKTKAGVLDFAYGEIFDSWKVSGQSNWMNRSACE